MAIINYYGSLVFGYYEQTWIQMKKDALAEYSVLSLFQARFIFRLFIGNLDKPRRKKKKRVQFSEDEQVILQ